jgi:hypothetical protein
MNKLAIPLILGTVVLVAGIFAVMPIEKAATVHDTFRGSIRDNVIVNSITLTPGQIMVIVDNAGIGGRSDVEVTWRFDPTQCQLARVDGTPPNITVTPFGNDGALGGNPAHSDQQNVDAIVLTTQEGQTCAINPALGQFITVSTVAASP